MHRTSESKKNISNKNRTFGADLSEAGTCALVPKEPQPIKSEKPFLTLISKPGRRIYIGYKELKDFNNGFKLYILRTSKGIISSQTAFKHKIGGELLFKISFVI